MRKSRAETNMEIAKIISQRGTCTRAKVGCVIVKDNRIIATGYNGAPSGLPHCEDRIGGCITDDTGSCITTVHAEAATIAFCARNGLSTDRSTLYVTMSPCVNCAKLIINAGIEAVVFEKRYKNEDGIRLLQEAKIGAFMVDYKEKGLTRVW